MEKHTRQELFDSYIGRERQDIEQDIDHCGEDCEDCTLLREYCDEHEDEACRLEYELDRVAEEEDRLLMWLNFPGNQSETFGRLLYETNLWIAWITLQEQLYLNNSIVIYSTIIHKGFEDSAVSIYKAIHGELESGVDWSKHSEDQDPPAKLID